MPLRKPYVGELVRPDRNWTYNCDRPTGSHLDKGLEMGASPDSQGTTEDERQIKKSLNFDTHQACSQVVHRKSAVPPREYESWGRALDPRRRRYSRPSHQLVRPEGSLGHGDRDDSAASGPNFNGSADKSLLVTCLPPLRSLASPYSIRSSSGAKLCLRIKISSWKETQ